MGYFYVAMTILLTLYGQLVLKWQVGLANQPAEGIWGKVEFWCTLLLRPWVLSGFVAAFAASLFWMLALTKLPLSTAYPFTALTFVLVIVFGAIVFSEPVNMTQILGTGLIVLGVIILGMR